MLDPFPLRPPAQLSAWTERIASRVYLDILPLHIHEVLLAALFYHVCCAYVSPFFSSRFAAQRYASFNFRTRLNWDVHVVSFVQSAFISILALWLLKTDPDRPSADFRERIWGYSGGNALIQALATGYFLWDLYISVRYVDLYGVGMIAHAISALWVYFLGFRPFTQYYAPIFILYELSSPCLNVHWFCDKMGATGGVVQLVNGVLLMATFFGCRLVWGVYNSIAVFHDIYQAYRYQYSLEGRAWMAARTAEVAVRAGLTWDADARAQVWAAVPREIPWWLAATYLTSNLTLTMLNVYWFGKMIATIRGRFPPPFGTKKVTGSGGKAEGGSGKASEAAAAAATGAKARGRG